MRLWVEHLRLAPKERHPVFDPRAGFELLRRGRGRLAAAAPRRAVRPEYYGDDLDALDAPPKYDPLNATHEVLRAHLVDRDGRNPDYPALHYAVLPLLLQSL